MRYILALLALLASAAAHAGTWAFDVNLASYHTRAWARQELNQDNSGLGLEYHMGPDWGAMAGFYLNSYRRTSVYALGTWTPLHASLPAGFRASAGLAAGLVLGYIRAECPTAPLAAAALLQLRTASGYGLNLLAVPNMSGKTGFVGLQAVFPL